MGPQQQELQQVRVHRTDDGTFFKSVQVVYEEEFIDNFEQIAKAYVATALAVTGIVTLHAKRQTAV